MNATTSIDEDALDLVPFAFNWTCVDDETGEDCVSPSRETLDIESFAAGGGVLGIPAGSLPIGKGIFEIGCVAKPSCNVFSIVDPSMTGSYKANIEIELVPTSDNNESSGRRLCVSVRRTHLVWYV